MRRVLVGLLGMIAACVVFAAPAGAASCLDADAPYAPGVNDAQVRSGLLCLVNNERLARGLGPVVQHTALDRAAQRHLEDMAARGFVDHVAPAPAPFGATPHERASAAGYPGTPQVANWQVGETLSVASQIVPITNPGMTTARAAMTSWMASPSHCKVILTRELQHLGAGVSRSSSQAGWVTDAFALLVGAPGDTMTTTAQCSATAGLVAADAVPAAPVSSTPSNSAPAASAPADSVSPRAALGTTERVAFGTTGVSLTSGAAITLRRGAAAAPMTLQCRRTAGHCRANAVLRVRGRVLGRAKVDLTAGGVKRLAVSIARAQRKRLERHRTRAILHVATTSATSARAVTLQG